MKFPVLRNGANILRQCKHSRQDSILNRAPVLAASNFERACSWTSSQELRSGFANKLAICQVFNKLRVFPVRPGRHCSAEARSLARSVISWAGASVRVLFSAAQRKRGPPTPASNAATCSNETMLHQMQFWCLGLSSGKRIERSLGTHTPGWWWTTTMRSWSGEWCTTMEN